MKQGIYPNAKHLYKKTTQSLADQTWMTNNLYFHTSVISIMLIWYFPLVTEATNASDAFIVNLNSSESQAKSF